MGVPTSAVIEKTISSSAAFDNFANVIASRMDIANNTGVDILVRRDYRGVAGVPMLVKDGQGYTVDGIFNCNEVWVSRAEGSGSITVQAVYFA